MGCFEYISCILKEFWDNCKYFKRYEGAEGGRLACSCLQLLLPPNGGCSMCYTEEMPTTTADIARRAGHGGHQCNCLQHSALDIEFGRWVLTNCILITGLQQ